MHVLLVGLVLVVACAATTSGPAPRLWGDVNADGAIHDDDAVLILRHATGGSIAPFDTLPGDVDANARVDTRDALVVRSYLAGYDVSQFRVGQLMP
jgi:hypothetical protein